MNKILKIVPAFLLLAALFINGGCGGSSAETKSKSTSLVTVAIGGSGKSVSLSIRPATMLARAELKLRRAWQSGVAIAVGIPAEVKSISIVVSAADMTTINRSIQILGQQEISDAFEVPNGLGRLFRVGALDAGGKSIYSGEATRDLFGVPVVLSFDMKPYTVVVTPTAGTNGSISPSVPEVQVGGSTKQFTITPSSGYRVVTPVGGTCPQGTLSGNIYTTGPLTADCTVTPAFVIATNTITPVIRPNGIVEPSTPQSVVTGSTKQFTITPGSGYRVVTPVGGTCSQGTLSGNTYTTGPITADCTLAPSFARTTNTVTPIKGANGTIIPSSPITLVTGSTTQFTIEPNNIGYSLVTPVGGTCPQGTLSGAIYTTGPITYDCTVAPTFSPYAYGVLPIDSANGSISPSGLQMVSAGSTTQFTITPNADYSIVTPIGGTCPQGILAGNTYTTGIITEHCSVAPAFIRYVTVTPSLVDYTESNLNSISPATPQVVVAGSTKQFIITTDNSGVGIVSVGGTCPLGTMSSPTYPDEITVIYVYTTGQITNSCTVEPVIDYLPCGLGGPC